MGAALLDAGHVLRDLDEMWRGIGKSEGAGVLRACAMTLVAISDENDGQQDAAEALAHLTREHPSRVVLIRVRQGLDAPESRANVQCWMPFGRRQQICAEQIEIDVPPGRFDEVLPVVRGVLVADLPVVVWCRSIALAGTPELEEVAALAGRLIVDTAGMDQARDAIALIGKLRRGRAAVSDLAWTRLTRWRDAVYSVFRTPEREAKLRKTSKIVISWAGEGMPATACYLAAWLKWIVPGAELELRCVDRARPERGMGRIREVVFECPNSTLRLRRPAGVGVAIEIDELEMRMLFPRLDAEALLREELTVFGHDAHFEAAFERAPAIASMKVEQE